MTTQPKAKFSILLSINRILRKIRRGLFELRAYVPGLRFQHKCERMIGPVGYWKALQEYQFTVLHSNGLKPEHSLLDVGCGPLQGGVPFIRYLNVSRYVGVDITPSHLDAAYQQVLNSGLVTKNPRLIHSVCFGDDYLADECFDFIFVSQLLYWFDENKITALLEMVSRRLKPGGKFLGDIVNPEKFASVSSFYSNYVPYSLEKIQQLAQPFGLQVRSLGEIVQYKYPARLTLKQNLMLEFARVA